MEKNTQKKSGSKGNHSKNSEKKPRRLTEKEQKIIKSDLRAGKSPSAIAKEFGVTYRTVARYNEQIRDKAAPPTPTGDLLKALEIKRIENHMARAADMLMDLMEAVESSKKYNPGEKIDHIGSAIFNLNSIHRTILLSADILGASQAAANMSPEIADMIVRLIPKENRGEIAAAIQATVQP